MYYSGLKKDDLQKAKNSLTAYSTKYEFVDPSVRIWRPVDGKNRIRIVPCLPIDKEDSSKFSPKNFLKVAWLLYVHRSIGDERKWFLCPKRMISEPCVICAERNKLPDDSPLKKSLAPTKIVLAWVWDRTTQETEAKGLQLGLLPYTLFNSIFSLCYDPETDDVIDIFHPKTGRDVFFLREIGENGFPKYSGLKYASKPSEVPDEILKQIRPISEIVNYSDEKTMKLHLYGFVDDITTPEVPDIEDDELDSIIDESDLE